MANPNPKNQFGPDRQPPGRGISHRTKLLKAIKAYRDDLDEDGFLLEYIKRAFSDADNATAMLREIFIRINPVPKAVSPEIEFDYPENGKPVEKIDAIIKGVSTGKIPADIGQIVVSMVKTGMEAQEITEIIERIEHLEKMLGGGVNGQEADE